MLQLDRVDIINDNLGAFDDLRTHLGAGAAKSSTTSSGRSSSTTRRSSPAGGNYISGATTNLGTDGVGLGLGVAAFRTMKAPRSSRATPTRSVTASVATGDGGCSA